MAEREAWMERDWTIVISIIVLITRVKQNRIQDRMCIWSKLRNTVEMAENKTKEVKVYWNHILNLIITLQLTTKIRQVRWGQIALKELLQLTFQLQVPKEQPKQWAKLSNRLAWSNSTAVKVKTKTKVNITEAKTWSMTTWEVKPKVKALFSSQTPFMARRGLMMWTHILLILFQRSIWTKTWIVKLVLRTINPWWLITICKIHRKILVRNSRLKVNRQVNHTS